jgi:energy-coupling factor transport system permease protein
MSGALDFVSNLDKDTWVHRIDPRVKLIMLCAFVICPLLFVEPWYLTGIVVLALPLWIGARIEIRPIHGLIDAIIVMAITSVVFSTFYNYDRLSPVYFSIGPLKATSVGFYIGLVLAYRMSIPSMVVIILIATTDPASLAKGLMKMRVPIPVAFMFLGSLRFFPLLFEEFTNITNAQTIRGIKKGGLSGMWRSFKLASFPLMINSLRRSRVMGLAVESKGFGKRAWNEYYQEFHLNLIDYLMIAYTILVVGAVLYVRYYLQLGSHVDFMP